MNTEQQITKAEKIADDLLLGADAIAQELGVEPSAVYYLAKSKRLPINKFGRYLIASRRALKRALAQLTS